MLYEVITDRERRLGVEPHQPGHQRGVRHGDADAGAQQHPALNHPHRTERGGERSRQREQRVPQVVAYPQARDQRRPT